MKSKRNKIFFLILAFFFSLTFFSVKADNYRKIIFIDTIKIHSLIDSVNKYQINEKYIQINLGVSIDYQNETSNAKGIIKIVTDSLIWISISPGLGIELIKAKFTNDSIMYFNKLDKTFVSDKWENFNKGKNDLLCFNFIQTIILNKLFLNNSDFSKINVSNKNDYTFLNYFYLIKKNSKDSSFYSFNYKITNTNFIKSLNIQNNRNINILSINNIDYLKQKHLIFVKKQTIELNIFNDSINIELEYKKIVFSKFKTISFKIPKGYSRIF